MTCPADMHMLLVALDENEAVPGDVARHVSACAACRERVADLRRVLAEVAASAPMEGAPDEHCLDEVAIAELLDDVNAVNRAARISHLAQCARCRAMIASVAVLLHDPQIASERDALERNTTTRRPARRRVVAGFLAAAAVIVAIAIPVTRTRDASDAPLHRAPTITGAAAPALVAPVGDVADARLLRWAPVPGADRYRVTVYDAASGVMYESEVAAVELSVPDSVKLLPGRPYLWKVEARSGFERWTSSEGLTEFRIVVPRPR